MRGCYTRCSAGVVQNHYGGRYARTNDGRSEKNLRSEKISSRYRFSTCGSSCVRRGPVPGHANPSAGSKAIGRHRDQAEISFGRYNEARFTRT